MQDGGSSIGSALRLKGWKSGSVVPSSAIEALGPYLNRESSSPSHLVKSGDWLVLISHTCDLYVPKLEAEPLAELLCCRPIQKPDTNFRNRKSTRRIHFRPNRAEFPDIWLDAHASRDRFLVPRELLTKCDPDPSRKLTTSAADALRSWLALRLERPGWPDGLNNLLGSMRNKLTDALSPLDDDTTELRVAIVEPAAIGGDYDLTVFLIVDEVVWNSGATARTVPQIAFEAFVSCLKSIPGLTVNSDSQAISGADFSWQMTRQTDLWNFANLTPTEE